MPSACPMQFKVPQFLEIEDKIFGPFTFRQFVYLAGGAGLCFILFRLLGIYLGGIPILLIAGFALLLAFYRPNDKPFVFMLEAGFKYVLQDKLYIYKKDEDRINERRATVSMEKVMDRNKVARLGGNKLRDLAWSLDVLDLNKHAEGK